MGVLANLPDGPYTIGFRCDDVSLSAAAGTLPFPGTVSVTELTGSENFVHVDVGLGTWVCLVNTVHAQEYAQGVAVDVHLDMQRAFAFGADGTLAAAPPLAASA
jgi:glycerol transport system ATP-binding protein